MRLPFFFASLAMALSAPAMAGPIHTPPPGSKERKAITDGLRDSEGQDRIYVIRRLKVKDNWAVITVDPQSRDDRQHYESETVVLHFETGIWVVVDYFCSEADLDQGGLCDRRKARKRLGEMILGLPTALLP